MSDTASNVECPNCGHLIDVNALLYAQVDEQLKKKYHDELARERAKYQQQAGALATEREQVALEKAELEAKIAAAVKTGMQAEKQRLRDAIKAEMAAEQSDRDRLLQEELEEKTKQLKDFNRTKAEFARLQREKDELKESLEAEAEKRLNERLAEDRQKIRKVEEERARLNLAERDKIIDQLNQQLKQFLDLQIKCRII